MTQKLLLASTGIANDAIRAALVDLLGKPTEDSNALFVPTAVLGFPDGDKFVPQITERFAEVGWRTFSTLELSNLSHLSEDEWLRKLDEVDALILSGGNEFYLSYWMEQSGLFDALPALLEQGKVYVGESASSMVVTAALNYDRDRLEKTGVYHDDEYDEGRSRDTGSAWALGLVDFVIRPHYQSDYFPQATPENVAKWAAKARRPLYALDDQSALKIVDGNVEVVSQGEWKFFDTDQIEVIPMSDQTATQTGVGAVAAMFAAAKAQNRAAFLPYYMIGYPTYDESLDAIEMMAREGVDGFEIGIPFSDPLADGPVNQAAAQVALANGMTTQRCLEAVRELRARGVRQPFLLMGYINPILSYGVDAYVRDVRAAGADGLIVPDMPLEESGTIADACAREGLATVLFVAPTSGLDRAHQAAEKATGFVYVLSVLGITGARSELPPDLTAFIHSLRTVAGKTPLVLGFGISTPEQARQVSELTDGFIVGSALVRAGQGGAEPVRALAASLRHAL